MLKTRFLTTFLIVLAVLFAQVGSVLAAPESQDATLITGTVESITVESGEDGVPTVVVTVLDDMGGSQTVRLSVETAAGLGLLQTDPDTGEPLLDPDTGLPMANEEQVGQTVEIDPTTVIPEEVPDEEPFNPVAGLLASFFDVTNAEINQLHEDGYGFGLIAQALWISQNVNGDPSLAGFILEAKSSGDYSNILLSDGTPLTLPDGTTPQNWGQFKKALSDKKNNLGVIVSGHAGDSVDDLTTTTQQQNGNGNGNGRGNHGNGNGNGKGNGNGNGNGRNNRP